MSQLTCFLKTENRYRRISVVNKWKLIHTSLSMHVHFRGKNGGSERMSPNRAIIEFTWHKM